MTIQNVIHIRLDVLFLGLDRDVWLNLQHVQVCLLLLNVLPHLLMLVEVNVLGLEVVLIDNVQVLLVQVIMILIVNVLIS